MKRSTNHFNYIASSKPHIYLDNIQPRNRCNVYWCIECSKDFSIREGIRNAIEEATCQSTLMSNQK